MTGCGVKRVRRLLGDFINGVGATNSAGRGRHDVTGRGEIRCGGPEANLHIDDVEGLIAILIGPGAIAHGDQMFGATDDAFGQQKTCDHVEIITRSAHGGSEGGAVESNLQGFFDGNLFLARDTSAIDRGPDDAPSSNSSSHDF